jgi:uncharacterized DUF497 family protein
MEFDWNNSPFELDGSLTVRDIEESFEDPFAVRLMPDSPRFGVQARFFNLGRSAAGTGIFSIYRTNGKIVRVICARVFTDQESYFYQRRLNQTLSS